MKRFLLDTSAVLTLRDDEPGADRVETLLRASDTRCLVSFMTRMELLYRVWKDEGEVAGRLALQQCRSLPVVWVEAEETVLQQAARIKATQRLSVADAWIAASAVERDAILVHKDPEFSALEIMQEPLPFK